MRPLTFNKQKALADVTQLFWLQGYEGTSVQQILDCMGLNRSSMYSVFGDKRTLFLLALEQFSELSSIACMPLLKVGNPKEAVTEFYEVVFFSLNDEQRKRGCLLVNTILEQSGLDDELALIAAEKLSKIERSFQYCFESAKAQGYLSQSSDPSALAAFFMTLTKGLRVSAREGCQEQEMRTQINMSLMLLD